MADAHKYQAHEVLNRVLNTAETAIQVDIVSGAEYAEDAAHTDEDTGNFVLGVRNDTLAALGGTDGDYVPFQMNALGALYVTNSAVIVDDAGFTPGTSSIQMVGAEFDDSGPDSVDEGDGGAIRMSANRNLYTTIRDAAGAEVGAGVLTATSDSDPDLDGLNLLGTHALLSARSDANTTAGLTAVNSTHNALHVAISDGAGIALVDGSNQLQVVEGSASSIQTAVEKIDNSIFADNAGFTLTTSSVNVAGGVYQSGTPGTLGDNDAGAVLLNSTSGQMVELMAGTETVGKVEVVGDVAENEDAAGNPVLAGGRYDSPGNTNSSLRTLGDTDVGALALDPTGALYVREYLGQTGSCFVSGTAAVTAAIGKFVAIQFLEDTVFNGTNGLVATDSGRWPDDTDAAADISSSNTAAVGSQVFPQGMTIFGRWDSFILVSGAVIAYVGNV